MTLDTLLRMSPWARHNPARFPAGAKPARSLCSFGGCQNVATVDSIGSAFRPLRAVCTAHYYATYVDVPAIEDLPDVPIPEKPTRTKTWTDDRVQELVEQRNTGLTLKALGDLHGVSRERIRQILKAHDASL